MKLSGTATALTLTALLSASAIGHAEKIKNIVLVHGAFADGSSWSGVTKRLQNKGYHVTAVQNPLTSLKDDVAATERVIERQKGDVLLVGHSWAGVVVTEAGNNPKVRGLVFISALVPESGGSAASLLEKFGAPMEGMTPDRDGLIWLDDPSDFQHVMAGDVSMDKVRLLTAVQQPISAKAFGDTVHKAAWSAKPSWYLMTRDDNALPFSVQQKIVAMTGSKTRQINSSHMSMISHPDDVATYIEQAAETYK